MHRFSSTRPDIVEHLIVVDLRDNTTTVVIEPTTRDGQGKRMCRLRAERIDELHDFVGDAGLGSAGCAVGSVSTLTHYVLTPKQGRQAARHGARRMDWSETFEWISRAVVAGTRPPQSTTPAQGARRSSTFTAQSGADVRQVSAATLTRSPFRKAQLVRAERFTSTVEKVAC